MLAYIFLFVLGISPVLQAVFDLPLQLALQRAVLLGCLAWSVVGAYGAGLPRGFSEKRFYPLWAAAGLSFISLLASPFKGFIFNEWGNYAAGLLIFLFASFLNREERGKVEFTVVCGAWLIFAVSLLQAFALENFLGKPPLTNLNALALYAVMVIPLALDRGNWLLAGAMVVLVVWTQSLGAALAGLVAAGFYAVSRFKGRELKENAWLLLALAALAVPVFYLLQADSVVGRLTWWRSAREMFAARPLAGFGHASFTWAQASFQPAGAFREHAVYAHNYYLEFLSENGLPAAVAWFWVLFSAARAKTGLVKYSVIAALVHSLMDFGLSVPANFWLFCWLLSSRSEGTGVFRPSRRAAGAGVVFASLLLAALAGLDFRSLSFEKARGRAAAAAGREGLPAAEAELRPALRSKLFKAPALELLGNLSIADKSAEPGFRSAVYYEMALLENRYSPSAWSALRRIYSRPGLEDEAAGLERRRLEVFK
ncbi:MAG: O-antigen ligase family protein [Elusimicrobiota bacterium]|nr:O-antigen ligase family protein [Elusimicrobiota bacterium]